MANWTEDAKQFTQDIIAKASFDQAVTMLQATPIGLAFGIGDVFLMTHDVAVGMGLLALEAQQEALNLEKRGLENRQDQELKGLEHQQATERAELGSRHAAAMNELVGRGAAKEQIDSLRHDQQRETSALDAKLHQGQEALRLKQQEEQHAFAEKQRVADLQQQEALRSKLNYCQTPTQQHTMR